MRVRRKVLAVLFCSTLLVITFYCGWLMVTMKPAVLVPEERLVSAVLVPAQVSDERLVSTVLVPDEKLVSTVPGEMEDSVALNSLDQQYTEKQSLALSTSRKIANVETAEEIVTTPHNKETISEDIVTRNDTKFIRLVTTTQPENQSPFRQTITNQKSPFRQTITNGNQKSLYTGERKPASTVANRNIVLYPTKASRDVFAVKKRVEMQPDPPINKATSSEETDLFLIKAGFHFPQPRAIKPLQEVLHSDWLKDLRATLHTMTSKQLTMVTSNLQYRDVLLNWLISAVIRGKIPLENILVISMDESVHRILQSKGVKSVLVTPRSFLTEAVRGTFPEVMMTRLGIIRLLNHWGFDVINYDTDAIILRDPQPIFDRLSKSGIIGTFGKFPQNLNHEWGITLCTAVLVVRSSLQTENYWEAMSREHLTSFSDQERMNYGLKAMNIRWTLSRATANDEVTGVCSNGMTVTLLPYTVACRASNCKKSGKNSYYVWHKGGHRDGESKMRNAEAGDMWFLRGDWQTACKGVTGYQWFKCISNHFILVT